MVRFTNSGTEACMGVLRLMRAYTKREKVIKFEGCYHGHADSFLVAAGSGVATLGLPDSPGVTNGASSDTLVATYNDIESVKVGRPRSVHRAPLSHSAAEPRARHCPSHGARPRLRRSPSPLPHSLALSHGSRASLSPRIALLCPRLCPPQALFEANKDEVAGVILEGVVGNSGFIVPDKAFLEELRQVRARASFCSERAAAQRAHTPSARAQEGGTDLCRPERCCFAVALPVHCPCSSVRSLF